MLDLRSATWEKDRAKAMADFVAGTISPDDQTILFRSISTAQWLSLHREKWALQHKATIDEARASDDLICRMLVALAEKP